jgi:hypothetical protein
VEESERTYYKAEASALSAWSRAELGLVRRGLAAARALVGDDLRDALHPVPCAHVLEEREREKERQTIIERASCTRCPSSTRVAVSVSAAAAAAAAAAGWARRPAAHAASAALLALAAFSAPSFSLSTTVARY